MVFTSSTQSFLIHFLSQHGIANNHSMQSSSCTKVYKSDFDIVTEKKDFDIVSNRKERYFELH